MTTTTRTTGTIAGPVEADHAAVRRAAVPVAIIATGAAAALSWLATNSLGESLVQTAVALVAGGLLFGLLVPFGLRRPSAGGRALAVAIVAVALTALAWWSALPIVLGASAALLGAAGRRAPRGSGIAIVALVLGLLAVIGDATMYLLDALIFH